MLEREIEKKFVDRAHRLGYQTVKLNTLGARGRAGWPDRMIIVPHGIMFIEFKRTPADKPSPRQQVCIDKLRALGHHVLVCCTAEEALHAVKIFAAKCRERVGRDV